MTTFEPLSEISDQGLIADINTQLEDENLPLMLPTLLQIAIYNLDEELFDYLIEKNADINKSFETYGSPVYLAVSKSSSNLNILRKLIEYGAEINLREFIYNWTPLHLACYYGKCEVAELLINYGADINMSNLYIMKNPTVNIGITPLHIAIERDQIRMVELLCRKNVNTNLESINRGTPLVYAILKERIDMVKILVKNGADVNKISKICKTRETALSFVVINEFSLTPLHAAIMKQQRRAVKVLLLNDKINVNIVIKELHTPLHYAVKVAPSIVTDLLNAGADINICIDNKTIIEYCIENNVSKKTIEEINQHIVKLRSAKLYN
ncbi:serine/threonine-protein kinase TNNI3K-like [Microplitis demolitor]|uniref:serine/threonine-protein kinase TNNI3K-like n=1 Tax=Microplitis demolitor TaxID=69319 RepID=UPI00235B632A|nr:serine/threonine-protein kinase TNNI3K-like [Microplitis demolitor]